MIVVTDFLLIRGRYTIISRGMRSYSLQCERNRKSISLSVHTTSIVQPPCQRVYGNLLAELFTVMLYDLTLRHTRYNWGPRNIEGGQGFYALLTIPMHACRRSVSALRSQLCVFQNLEALSTAYIYLQGTA